MPPEVFLRRQTIAQTQIEQLRVLLRAILPANPFYAAKLDAAGASAKVAHLGDFSARFPLTTKAELVADQAAHPPFGTNLTFPPQRYTRSHQTSGTGGVPLRWLDTPESWSWMVGSWQTILRAAGVTERDHLFFAFSFGPFIGFWLAYEAAIQSGCRVLPGGGMTSIARLRSILDQGATVLCCTPTYALHLAEVAAEQHIDLSTSSVRLLIVAGEPGGSLPATRTRLTSAWPRARVFDHHGMTETGPVTFECPVRPGVLHALETAYIAEIIDPATGQAVHAGDTGELVLTTLGRTGSPLLRYRTGDLVRAGSDAVCDCGRSDLALDGGILGRTDDMVVVRGVNVYPSALDEVVRAQEGVVEYQVRVDHQATLTELSVEVEAQPTVADPNDLAERLQAGFQTAFNLRVPVRVVAAGSLPRFEMKAKRWLRF